MTQFSGVVAAVFSTFRFLIAVRARERGKFIFMERANFFLPPFFSLEVKSFEFQGELIIRLLFFVQAVRRVY